MHAVFSLIVIHFSCTIWRLIHVPQTVFILRVELSRIQLKWLSRNSTYRNKAFKFALWVQNSSQKYDVSSPLGNPKLQSKYKQQLNPEFRLFKSLIQFFSPETILPLLKCISTFYATTMQACILKHTTFLSNFFQLIQNTLL